MVDIDDSEFQKIVVVEAARRARFFTRCPLDRDAAVNGALFDVWMMLRSNDSRFADPRFVLMCARWSVSRFFRREFRRQRVNREVCSLQDEVFDGVTRLDSTVPDDIVLEDYSATDISRLDWLLSNLNFRRRQLLVMYFCQGLNFREIAERVGRTRQNVCTGVRRALAACQRAYVRRYGRNQEGVSL